jgi:hypothetical protein
MAKDFSQHGRFADVAEMIDNNDHTGAIAVVYRRLGYGPACSFIMGLREARNNTACPIDIAAIDAMLEKRRIALKDVVKRTATHQQKEELRTLV